MHELVVNSDEKLGGIDGIYLNQRIMASDLGGELGTLEVYTMFYIR